jgi:hypothetical protein
MPEMNKMNANIPAQNWNPVSALSNKMNKGASSLNATGKGIIGMAHAEKMQGSQHEHERTMQGAQHGHEAHLATIGGAVDIEKEKIRGRSAMGVARIQGKTQTDISQIEADSSFKEQAAGHRHEIRTTVLNHRNDLEKKAADHHNAVHAAAEASVNSINEASHRNNHEIAVKSLEDTHAGNASTRAVSFLDALSKHAAPGTEASLDHQGVRATFTFAHPEAPKQETPAAPAAPEEPKKTAAPVAVGMPSVPPKKEPPSSSEPTPAKGLLINHPVTGRTVRRDSLSAEEIQAAEAKKSTKKTSSAPKTGTVDRDPKTGRAMSKRKK